MQHVVCRAEVRCRLVVFHVVYCVAFRWCRMFLRAVVAPYMCRVPGYGPCWVGTADIRESHGGT